MLSFAIRRLISGIPILFGTLLILFICFNVVPGDVAMQLAGKHATPEQIEVIRKELGLDQPLLVQFWNLVKQTVTFDFGRSFITKQRISEIILNGAGPSFSLVAPPFFISAIMSILTGLLLAYFRGTLMDRGLVSLFVAMQSVSVLVYIIFGQYVVAYLWGLLPISGYDPSLTGRWQYLVLPGLIYILLSIAPQARFYRTIFLDELYQDYVRTARSKGLGERAVLLKHVLKNAMIPIITSLVLALPFLILGALLLESYFSIPGLGDLIVNATRNGDFPVLVATTVLGTIAYIIFNILSDLLYALVDPRVNLK